MTIPQFEDLSLTLGISGLMLYMVFIMYSLGKESGAGKFGMFVIFLSLGLGMVGFAAKTIIQMLIHV
jgi:hypothetical protein